MAIPILTLRDIAIAFGGKVVLESVSFSLEPGDRVCLVGKNGSGKSTLLKIITGHLEQDAGERFVQPGTRIGYLPQAVRFNPGETVYEYVLAALQRKEDDTDETVRYRADIVLSHFYLEGNAFMAEQSGGQQRRAALARALIEEPDLLLLDEPTNHLDISAIEWLEVFLRNYKGALLCISHDRTFLANTSNKTFWLDRGTIRTNPAGYSDFDRWSELLIEQEAAQLEKLSKSMDKENLWLQHGVTARRKRNVRRLKDLYRLREQLKSQRSLYRQATSTIKLPPLSETQASKLILEMDSVYKSFGEKKIIEDFSTRIMRGDKVGVIGKNGSGKSTFIKMMMNRMVQDKGTLRRGHTAIKFDQEVTYYDQDRNELDPTKTLWETLCPEGGDQVTFGKSSRHVVGYLKDFLFDPKVARDKVATLSGGQANRLMLAKILASPGSILILDEPTNDLDVDTLDMLQEILSDYKGTLIIVSHDRDFIDRIVTRTIAFEGEGVVYESVGGYSDYMAEKKRSLDETRAPKKQTSAAVEVKETPVEKPKKLTFKQQHLLKTLPDTMAALEEEIITLQQELSNPELYMKEPERFDRLLRRLPLKQKELTQAEHEWLELEVLKEKLGG